MMKYNNRPVYYQGMRFDSIKEYNRWCELRLLEKSGAISDLRRQVSFELIPEQRGISPGAYTKGLKKGKEKPGPVIEKPVKYVADFVYLENGRDTVEDAKGHKTKEYVIKRKLMLYRYGIRIKET